MGHIEAKERVKTYRKIPLALMHRRMAGIKMLVRDNQHQIHSQAKVFG